MLTNFEASITITLLDTKLNLGKVADHTTINAIDVVGSSQIILPMPNLERAY